MAIKKILIIFVFLFFSINSVFAATDPGGGGGGGGTPKPTARPTTRPTPVPTKVPTKTPTKAPTAVPTKVPTKAPTAVPTKAPTAAPTKTPTKTPTKAPTSTPAPTACTTGCSTARCGECSSSASGWRCKCDTSGCRGVNDSTCVVPTAPTPTPTIPPVPTAVPTPIMPPCVNGTTASASVCFSSSSGECSKSGSGTSGSCSWDSSSYCLCVNNSWVRRGGGCHASFTCSGEYLNSCPSGMSCNAYVSECIPCGNDKKTCYKPIVNPLVCPCGDTNKVCSGVRYTGTCAGGTPNVNCYGTRTPNCACAANTCVGGQCDDGCGGKCNGTLKADCSDSNNYKKGTTYTSKNGCGICTGTKELSCSPNCSGSSNYCKGTSFESSNDCGLCIGTKDCSFVCHKDCSCEIWTPVGQVCSDGCGGTCNGKLTTCDKGETCPTICHDENIYVPDGTCGTKTCTPIPCPVSPTFKSLIIKNKSDLIINPEIGNKNQVCDARFIDNVVRFVVEFEDLDGNNDILSVELRVGGQTYNPSSLVNGTAIFNIPFINSPLSTSNIEVKATDKSGLSKGWIDTSRILKIWNCAVSISGSLYDGSMATMDTINCGDSNPDFINLVGNTINYSLSFYSPANSLIGRTMTVSSPNFSSESNGLVWGNTYFASFKDFSTLFGSDPSSNMRIPGSLTCKSSLTLDNSTVDPYSNDPTIKVDFSAILAQLPWYQSAGAGVMAKNSIYDFIPSTCTVLNNCTPVVSKNFNSENLSGIVAAKTINVGSGSYSENKNQYVNKNLIGNDYAYKYFYNDFYVTANQGKHYNSSKKLSDVLVENNGQGVILINGNLEIDTDNSLEIGKFLMVISSGDILVKSNVITNTGIFVTDKNFVIDGKSNDQYILSGTIYAGNNVVINRGFTDKVKNNKEAAFVVNYRPDFIFTMPGKLVKKFTNWREGI